MSAGILGIGVVGLMNSFFFTENSISVSKQRAAAVEMAQQRVERLVGRTIASVPQCALQQGCRLNRQTYAPMKSPVGNYACSEMRDGMSTRAAGTSALSTGAFRVDTVVTAHPDPNQQAGAVTVSVNVCWTNNEGVVQEVEAQRLMVPEV